MEKYDGQMEYALGTDTVPAMLTPGEAVIPAPAAQDPANKPAIRRMIEEGRKANQQFKGKVSEEGFNNGTGYVDADGIRWHWMGPPQKKEVPPMYYNQGGMDVDIPAPQMSMMAAPLMNKKQIDTAKFMMDQQRKNEMHQLNMQLKLDAHNRK